jgi:hypothetical protein
MKNALNNQVGMLGDMFLCLVANLKQGVIYFIKQALPPNISAGSVHLISARDQPERKQVYFSIPLHKRIQLERKVCTIKNNTNLNLIFCLIKCSKIDFIFLPAFYLIMWLMTSSKNFEKIAILKK